MSNELNSSARQLGFWMCVALVIGNIVGSGIFLLPASLAPYGLNSVWAWLLTSAGAIGLALVFAGLSRGLPTAGGPYDYTRLAFGALPGFLVMWCYWISVWVGIAAIATALVSYLSNLLPWIASTHAASILLTIGFIWLLTAVNVLGTRSAGKVQVVTTAVKLIPLLAIVGLGVYLALRASPLLETTHLTSTHFDLSAVTAAATLTLFALCGMESAAVASGKVRDPARTIPRATIVGTVLAAVVYIIASTTIMLLVPGDRLAQSNAPFADVAAMFWGPGVAHWFALFAAISCFGALNGWILVNGQLGFQLGRSGLFPKSFAHETAARTPAISLFVSSAFASVLVLMNFGKSVVAIFTFLVLLSTTAVLFMYLLCSLAALKLLRNGTIPSSKANMGLALGGAIGAAFSLWALAGAGISTDPHTCGASLICWTPWQTNPVYLGFVLLVVGVPIFYAMRTRNVVTQPALP